MLRRYLLQLRTRLGSGFLSGVHELPKCNSNSRLHTSEVSQRSTGSKILRLTLYSTLTETYTRVSTDIDLSRITPQSTFTVTVTPGGAQSKRDTEPQITPGALSPKQIEEHLAVFKRQNQVGSNTADLASMSAGFSSACSCQDYSGPTLTETYTDATEVHSRHWLATPSMLTASIGYYSLCLREIDNNCSHNDYCCCQSCCYNCDCPLSVLFIWCSLVWVRQFSTFWDRR